MAEPGDNTGVDVTRLQGFVRRLEVIDDQIALHREDLKAVMAEAKSDGFDPKALRRLIAMRKRDPEKVRHEQAVFETYANALELFG